MRIYTLILIIFLVGCKAKKEFTQVTETKVSDTLVLKTEVIKSPPILSSLTINDLCDSVTQKPKQFSHNFKIGDDSVNLKVVGDSLIFVINQLEKELQRKDSIARIKDTSKDVKQSSKIIKIDKQWDFVLYSFLIGGLLGATYKIWLPWVGRVLKFIKNLF